MLKALKEWITLFNHDRKIEISINAFEVEYNVVLTETLKDFFLCDYSKTSIEIESSRGGKKSIETIDFYTARQLYEKLLRDSTYESIFCRTFIPIAADNSDEPNDVLCYDLVSRKLFLYWLLLWDPLNPIEWQLEVKEIDETLACLSQQ